ncbi:MAG: glutamyl-tRNA reductase [Bacillota bacterium]|nr:glutamyl-tRNA reductase [Bacillota bacterium]
MLKNFGLIGLNHKETPIEIREKIHFYDKDKIESLSYFSENFVEEALILSTCNRTEIYFVGENIDQAAANIEGYLKDFFQVDLEGRQLIKLYNEEALRHLFNTAIGLESLIIGEDQILGQITDAQILAIEVGSAGKYLNKVFREAITFAKWTKTQSGVSAIPVSISYMGIRKIEEALRLENEKALVIGLGDMGKLAAMYLVERGAQVIVANRTYENSVKVSKDLGGLDIVHYKDLDQAILDCKILITATSSPHTIIKEKNIEPRTEDLYIMDLGLPRDVEASVGDMDHVHLYDIDNLKELSDENLKKKKDLLDKFQPEIQEKISEITRWWTQTKVDPIMESADQRCKEIADVTLNYIFRKTHLSHREKGKVEKIVRASIRRAMREPLVALKNMESTEEKNIAIKVLKEVFDL